MRPFSPCKTGQAELALPAISLSLSVCHLQFIETSMGKYGNGEIDYTRCTPMSDMAGTLSKTMPSCYGN
jgi:hypothetical protein